MKRFTSLVLLSFALLAFVVTPLWACSVPVFRYALERWPADPYDVFVFHRGDLSESDRALLERLIPAELDGRGVANTRLHLVDLDGDPGDEELELWERQPGDSLPWLAVRHQNADRVPVDVWSAPFDAVHVERLLESPTRADVAQQLLSGTSVVWLLLESGNREADDAAAELLARRLEELQGQMQLPEVDEQDIADGLLDIDPQQLKLKFSMRRLSRDDPEEAALVDMLLATESDLREFDEPMAFPVFGRGRVLYALVGAGINDDTLERASYELIGPCTCQVKDENPGSDLLMAVDWERLVVPSSTEPDRPLPPLPGLPDLTVHEEPDHVTTPDDQVAVLDPGPLPANGATSDDTTEAAPVAAAQANDSEPPQRGAVLTNTLVLAGIGLLVVVAGSVVLLSRKSNSVGTH